MKKLLAITGLFLSASFCEMNAQTGSALNFDGTNDYVNVGNVLGASYTKEAWVMITNGTLLNHIISGGTTGQHVLWAPAMYGNRLSAGHNGSFNLVQDPTPLTLGVWYHVAVTYDAATTTMRLYKNGVLVSTNTSVPAYTGGNVVRIGAYNTSNVIGGSMDEVRIWNVVRTQAQISSNMSCPLSSIPSGLNQYYRFNQGTASGNNAGQTTLTDIAGTAQNGTLVNFALTGATSNWIAPGGVPSTVGASITGQTNVTCNGANDGTATVTASGGGPYTYAWAPAGGTAASATGLAPGTYTCTVSNQCGQSVTATVTLTEPTAVVSSPGGTSPICQGQSTTINANASGGTSPYTYAWSPGGLTNASEVVAPSGSTTYTVIVTDNTGCTGTNTLSITVNPTPTINVVSNPANGIVCSSTQATLTASGNSVSYSWTGGISNGVAFTPVSTTTYTVTGTSSAGCTNTATRTITVNNCNNLSQLTPACCNLNNATLSTWLYNTAVTGATNYEYKFTNTSTSAVYSRVKGNNQPNMPLSYVSGLTYGSSYYVQVRSFVNNTWTQFGNLTTCMITMAATPPPTTLLASTCGATGLTHTSRVYCQGVAGSTAYWWSLQAPSYYQGYTSSIANISLSQWTSLQPNTTYTLTVYHYAAGVWSTASPTCTITMGAVVRLAGTDATEEGVEENADFNFGVSMYPNPLGQDVNPTVTITGADQQNAVVTVMDLTGRVITSYQMYVEGDEYAAQLTEFPELVAGMYIMQVQIGDKVETQKFIAE